MDKELEEVIKKFLDYSFDDIEHNYDKLTTTEKSFCTREEFRKIVQWIKVPGEGIEPSKTAV